MQRNATARWSGTITEGKGHLTAPSKVLQDTPYSFQTRFKNEDGQAGTNPEELIAAAHAGCFTMALSKGLGDAGYTINHLTTKAKVALEPDGEGFKIPTVDLTTTVDVPEIGDDELEKIAQATKENCPVSKVLNAKISLTVKRA